MGCLLPVQSKDGILTYKDQRNPTRLLLVHINRQRMASLGNLIVALRLKNRDIRKICKVSRVVVYKAVLGDGQLIRSENNQTQIKGLKWQDY